jgi:hypothetical protein
VTDGPPNRRTLERKGLMSPHDTLEQLRADIDSGRTGDKVSAPDPAMAPLGTDDEAAGTPPSPASIALTRRLENSHPHQSKTQTGLGHAWMLIAIVIALAAAIVGWGFLSGKS